MLMTEFEIKHYFKQVSTEKQNEQVMIFSQLNACPISKIEKILGVNYNKLLESKPGKKLCVPHDRAMKLHAMGKNDSEIAKALELNSGRVVGYWRKRHNLPSNFHRGGKHV